MSMQSICAKSFYGTEAVYERKNRLYQLSACSRKGLQRCKREKDLYERYVSARYDLILRPAYEMAMVQSQNDGWPMSELQ